MEPFKHAIEERSGSSLRIIPNRSALGLEALLDGRADLAMLSAPLENELASLGDRPSEVTAKLQVHRIGGTRVAVGVHPSNTVRTASLSQLTQALRGEIDNWSALGGADRPIRIVVVGEGGGVTTTLQAVLLDGKPITAANILYVRTAVQLAWVVEQDPRTLAFGQLALFDQRGVPQVATDRPIEQPLNFISLGAPTRAMQAVIDASRVFVTDDNGALH